MLPVCCDRGALLVESAVKRVVSVPVKWVAERSSSRSPAVGRRRPGMVTVRSYYLGYCYRLRLIAAASSRQLSPKCKRT